MVVPFVTYLFQLKTMIIQRSNIEKVMITVFQIIHVIFALDFGFLKHKSCKTKRVLNLFSFIKCVIVSLASLHAIYNYEGVVTTVCFSSYLIQYLICVTILTFCEADLTFCNFYSELRQIDAKLNVGVLAYRVEFKILLSIFSCFLYRVISTLIYCMLSNRCVKPYWASVVFFLVYFCLETCLVCYTFIFYMGNCRLQNLLVTLTTNRSNFAFFQHVYKSIIDIVEKYKTAFDPVFTVVLFFTIPAMVTSTFASVKHYVHQIKIEPEDLSAELAVLVETFILIVTPALVADTLTTQADKIKLILHEKCLQQQDVPQRYDIVRFIHYVEARPCQFRVCKVIPLNASLLGIVLHFWVTYLIVIIQFTFVT